MSSSILDMSTSPTTAPAPCLSSGATRRSSRRRRTLVPKDDASFSSSSSSSPSSSDPSDDDDEDYLDDDGVAIDPKRRRQRKTRKRVDGRVWPSQCDVADCRVTLRDQPAYRLHHRRYHRVREGISFTCKRCFQQFSTKHALKVHCPCPNGVVSAPFVCDLPRCGKHFVDEAKAIQHVVFLHEVREGVTFTCDQCQIEFLTRHEFNLHFKDVVHQYICAIPTCAANLSAKRHLVRHTERLHDAKPGVQYTCDPCDIHFQTRHELDLHNRATTHDSFRCDFPDCEERYSKREHLNRHILSVHNSDDNQEKPFRCDLCHIGFAYNHGLVRHRNRSHRNQNRPYECAQCLLAFKKKSELQAHSYVHTGVLPFECEVCGQRFLKRFHLGRHARSHASAKSSQAQVIFCEEEDCGEMLFSLDEKAQHDREVHNKKTVETGDNAGDDTASRNAQRDRKRKREQQQQQTDAAIHENRRQLLECKICERTFQRKQNLRAHLRTHFEAVDERKMHVCPMVGCANAYTRKSNLMAHYNAVHDEVRSQRFVCPYAGCEGKFGYKKVLMTHIDSVHVNPTPSKTKQRKQKAVDSRARILGTSELDVVIGIKDDPEAVQVS